MAARNAHGPGFFRVLFPGFNTKMSLPSVFVKQIMEGGKCSSGAEVVNPNGQSWHVNVWSDKKGTYFGGSGWLELAKAHNLGVGHFMCFVYKGRMVFSFRAYDLSTCEIMYPSARQNGAEEDHESATNQRPTDPSFNHGVRKYYACKARSFEAVINEFNLMRNYMYIPIKIIDTGDLLKQREVTLLDPSGQSWPIAIHQKKFRGTRRPECYMSDGWLHFARSNAIKRGDRCLFQLASDGKGTVIMHVSVCRCFDVDRDCSWIDGTRLITRRSCSVLDCFFFH